MEPGRKVRLPHDYDTAFEPDNLDQEGRRAAAPRGIELLAEYQARLAAQDTYGLLVVFQAMDAAGKDGTIKHVMSGVNPQGVEVSSFKVPSAEELDHDYLWRYAKRMPGRGTIGIFNRCYYEETLVVRVHKEILLGQHLPESAKRGDVWARRFREINDWERYLTDNGIRIVKLFLNVSQARSRSGGSCAGSRSPSGTGSSRRPTSASASAGTTTRRRSPRCSPTPAPSTRRGT